MAHEIFSWGTGSLVSWPGIEHGPPALRAQSLSHWPAGKSRPYRGRRCGHSPPGPGCLSTGNLKLEAGRRDTTETGDRTNVWGLYRQRSLSRKGRQSERLRIWIKRPRIAHTPVPSKDFHRGWQEDFMASSSISKSFQGGTLKNKKNEKGLYQNSSLSRTIQ